MKFLHMLKKYIFMLLIHAYSLKNKIPYWIRASINWKKISFWLFSNGAIYDKDTMDKDSVVDFEIWDETIYFK